MYTAVALDGPAGAGKSSIAKRAAKALDFIYVDTGALYRTIGYAATLKGIEPVDSREVDELLKTTKVDLTFNDKGEQIVLLNGEDVSGFIRTPEASMTASKISGTFWASSKIAPSGKANRKSIGLAAAISRKALSSNETYRFSGKTILARVDLPLCLGPVMPITANWEASLKRASFAVLSIIVLPFSVISATKIVKI